jgi:hypothetical protein
LCLLLLACTPETDLGQAQAAAPPAESGSGTLSSPPPDPLAGQLVEPPSGATSIPTNLATLVVRFTEPVQPAGIAAPFLLRSALGGEMGLALGGEVPCAEACYQLSLAGELTPSSLHTLEVAPGGLQFLDGKPTPAGTAGGFTTGSASDLFAPRVVAFTAEVAAGCVVGHLAADEPVRVEIVLGGAEPTVILPAGDFASTLDFAVRLPPVVTGEGAVSARIADRAGNRAESAALPVALPPPVPRLSITEVMANPAGSETTQEFVEIYNAGSEALALGGLQIQDKTGSDPLPEATLQPGAFALVVAEKYDPAASGDVPPRPDALLLRVPGRIGSDGLSNTGEVVRLLTASGEVISQYGGYVDVSASAWSGKSVKRASLDACDAPSAWSATPSAATPGW